MASLAKNHPPAFSHFKRSGSRASLKSMRKLNNKRIIRNRFHRALLHLQQRTSEKARLLVWIDWIQQHLASTLSTPPDAFNLGLNDGPAAGQTMSQFHFHVIPRYTGDVPDPRGGVRHVIPSKARYW